ncbi:hypothetical protein PSTG_01519 [Puccinia striiformis f. sp. tritici PST-78]|uniref:hAT-like transposase RNase-H fold domain-containing protein n=1 Tax=Puccinia striiformis f. sp. tritici PST-78 TaxID=1165861 RepID=A0A0L0W1B7_9BASI|nr:hypothetical protein PSTG_01519 [Puccinia striiformis f. sp. tritici PST-78]
MVADKSRAFNFDHRILNQIIVMWLVRHSLPWNQIEDHEIDFAFRYSQPGLKLNSWVWAASEAHKLYCNLQEKVISTLNNLPSKITLIHDVWTTKGNRQAFMGISAAYVSENWEFKVIHLGLKYIAWTQKGKFLAVPFANIITKSMLHTKITQTTDSGSNNGTMAVGVGRIVSQKTGTYMNLLNNSIQCFCHKVALILKAGLDSIGVGEAGYTKKKQDGLRFVPGLESIAEEAEDIDGSNLFREEGTVPLLDGSESDSEASDSKAGTTPGDRIAAVFKKVDAVFLKITGSAAKQSEYKFWAPKVEKVAPPTLIAGYGIRWNIKFQSRDRADQGQNAIHKLIEIERAHQDQEGGKNFFDNVEITPGNWKVVKRLNDVLKEFYFITKKMEGDISSAGMMLAEYRWIKTFLNQQLVLPNNTEFRPMFRKMITKTNKYVEEALNCDVILLATALNPSYHLSMLEMWFPSHFQYAKSLIEAQFESKRIELEAHAPTTRHPPTSEEPRDGI